MSLSVVSDAVLHEQRRLAALHEYRLLDAPADDELEAVVRVAAMVAGVPTATLNLIDEHRQCQLTTTGFAGCDSARSDSMCAIRFETGKFTYIPDASLDPTYAPNPWVTGALGNVRFYASAPLVTPEGHALGSLCVFDVVPGVLDNAQIARLQDLAGVILALFERRRQSRINAELAIQAERSKKFTDTVLEAIDVAVVAADQRGRSRLFNRAAREWLGMAAAEAEPAADRYTLLAADGATPLPPDRAPLHRALHSGGFDASELIVRRTGVDDRQVTATGRPLTARDGTPLGAVVALHDVTADRTHRRALERAHAELAERGEQLAATVAELRRSNTELEQFAGVVSHDLVAPLGVVSGYLELIADVHEADLDEQSTAWIEKALSATMRMRRLIEALLSYARAGNAPYRPQPTDLAEILEQVQLDLRTAIADSGTELTIAPLPTVDGDPTLLRQLLQNLVGNAIKYRDPARPCRVAIAAVPDGDRYTVTVADNGIGIPPEHRDRIFDMFARVDGTAAHGHGIGLSTCERIVDRHGGRIRVADRPGPGTTITFTLPAVG
ncbi:hypothetical protein GCM10010123_10750 [Pilimelia anulata]|uniref:Sensor-like histidine kinase SenX3 n=1 Tax=Pilimelia anulata TaxID=53371 RepID=A0A8J3B460_9ACTN|nr:ATP-binding protein [Pilimelia anulata]GGJ82957.1 hypothetical protein GCM10010123_10750 [Pilimelia anulata]